MNLKDKDLATAWEIWTSDFDTPEISFFYSKYTGDIKGISVVYKSFVELVLTHDPFNLEQSDKAEVFFKKDENQILIERETGNDNIKPQTTILPDGLIAVDIQGKNTKKHIKFLAKPAIPHQKLYEIISTPEFTGWDQCSALIEDTIQVQQESA